ncbi:MAG: LacI family DNA-binding transcriptional regulator [Spirochaetales bacterium]|nr:LacI family DNA-binding transcriptional regulator [Spirochaetales bacterium]
MNKNPRKKIIIDDVAKLANVSTATVSRVINGFDGVSIEISDRVNNAIEKLGYLKPVKDRNKSKVVGVVVPHIQNPYSSNLINETQNTLEDLGYKVVIMDFKNNPDKAVECVEYLVDYGVSGVVFIPAHFESERDRDILDFDIPKVFLGRKIDKNNNFVGSENYKGIYNGVNYLFSLGHKDILYVAGDERNLNIPCVEKDCFDGFFNAHSDKNVEFNPENLISGDFDIEVSYNEVLKKLKNRRFTAIFTAGDIMAYGAYKACLSQGLRIPEDISILGFDDLPMSSAFNLTTVGQNAFSIGQNAGFLMDALITGKKEEPQEIILPTNLAIRTSCGICNN